MVSSKQNQRKGGISVKRGWNTVLLFVVLVALMFVYEVVTHTFEPFQAVVAVLCLFILVEEQYRTSKKKSGGIAGAVALIAACALFLVWVIYRVVTGELSLFLIPLACFVLGFLIKQSVTNRHK